MKKYRISKYKPSMRDEQGRYVINEWTSYSDIGKLYNSKIFNSNEYEYIENKYIQALMMILKDKNIDKLVIRELEKNFSTKEIEKLLIDSNLSLSQTEKELFQSIKNESEISINQIDAISKLLLRECLWCRLNSPKNDLIVEIGYDFYLYICCDNISQHIINDVHKLQMYIEEMKL